VLAGAAAKSLRSAALAVRKQAIARDAGKQAASTGGVGGLVAGNRPHDE
jgi:hypothetical protein